jgi:hypothetical protein
VRLLEEARKTSARSVNAIMTATYWEIGHRIVEREQQGRTRAGYGEALIERLAADLTAKFGRGFSRSNLWQMRDFYMAWPIVQAVPAQLESTSSPPGAQQKLQTLSGELGTGPTQREPSQLVGQRLQAPLNFFRDLLNHICIGTRPGDTKVAGYPRLRPGALFDLARLCCQHAIFLFPAWQRLRRFGS